MSKILVEVDDVCLAKAAAKLGTKTKKATIGKALELAAREEDDIRREAAEWDEWADEVAARLSEVDWRQAWG